MIPQHLRTEPQALLEFLSKGFVKNVGPAFAEKLQSFWGSEIFSKLETSNLLVSEHVNLHRFTDFEKQKLSSLLQMWLSDPIKCRSIAFLIRIGFGRSLSLKLYATYKQRAISLVLQDPYCFASMFNGIGFLTTDSVAKKIGIPEESLQRFCAAIKHILKSCLEDGGVFLESQSLFLELTKILKLSAEICSPIFTNAIDALTKNNQISSVKKGQRTFYALNKAYLAEQEVALFLKNRCRKIESEKKLQSCGGTDLAPEQSVNPDHNPNEFMLTSTQKKAIECALAHPISVITGGPGTGKTTILRELTKILKKEHLTMSLCAPTGRAAKRISQTTGLFAQTIHRLLEFSQKSYKFERNEHRPLETDFVIIDEFSMVDLFLAAYLFRAISQKTKIVCIGDVDQLPSVGPGKLLADFINCKKIPTTRLDTVFRQSKMSSITENAHRINMGQFPIKPTAACKKDFILIKKENDSDFEKTVEEFYTNTLKTHNIDPKNSVILAPMHKGNAGTANCNKIAQNLLNSKNNHGILVFSQKFKVGDPVIQQKNNYEKFVFNGDIGTITEISSSMTNPSITVSFDERAINYSSHELSELALAYAISVHKSQGSEFDAVLIPVFTQHFIMLNKNILYTAITRAKKLCVLVGQVKAVAIAIKKSGPDNRVTFLKDLLENF